MSTIIVNDNMYVLTSLSIPNYSPHTTHTLQVLVGCNILTVVHTSNTAPERRHVGMGRPDYRMGGPCLCRASQGHEGAGPETMRGAQVVWDMCGTLTMTTVETELLEI